MMRMRTLRKTVLAMTVAALAALLLASCEYDSGYIPYETEVHRQLSAGTYEGASDSTLYRLTIGAFLVVFALIYFGMRRHYRQGPYIPFKGIDYLGGILWSLWLICIVFICVYGEYYDWLDSEEIWTAIVFAVILLALCLYRAATIRHPYISLGTFRQHNMLYIFLLFGCMTLMSATATNTQNIFTNAILHYDARHNADLNWGVVIGIAAGTYFFYLGMKYKWRIKTIVLTGFFSFLLYQVMLYYLIDASTEKYMLYLPLVFKGAGVSIVYTSLTYVF